MLHPLFLELVDAQLPAMLEQRRAERRSWESFQNGHIQAAAVPLGPMEEGGVAFHNGGSSIGAVSMISHVF